MNVNFSDALLRNVRIDPDFLTKVYLGGCVIEKSGCSITGGAIADFNVWSRALSAEEMEDWTACR